MIALTLLAAAVSLNPLDMRWTFGAHEPYTMYRRMGVRSTGGIDGNACWLRDWFNWWDSEDCPKLMEELGLNWLLCRFYKGMGWKEEVKDFPNVKRFVENCHKHGVRAVAYVQYATFYPETMKREIPNLEDWAGRDWKDNIHLYSNYSRWEPCLTCEEYEAYLKKVIRIALVEGGYDGVFFDNAYSRPCYCKRCAKLFHEHLQTIEDPAERFGFDDLSGMGLPLYPPPSFGRMSMGEIREPLQQEFLTWRARRMTELFRRLGAYAHSVRKDCVFAANICSVRAPFTFMRKAVDMTEFPGLFDLAMGQCENSPHMEGDAIVSRARDLKYAKEFPAVTYFASCDGAGGQTVKEDESLYLLPLMEDAVFGGVPADRTVMAPYPEEPEFVNHARLERRRPLLKKYNDFIRENRESFTLPSAMPVRLLVSGPSMAWSQASYDSLMAVEEVALRAHLPFGYSISTEKDPLPHASDAKVIVIADQRCLSDAQIAAIVDYAKKGGRLVVTGLSGRYDEWNRQRFTNPLHDAVAWMPNVSWRDDPDVASEVKRMDQMRFVISPPKDGVRPLKEDLAKVGYSYDVEVVTAPENTFVEIRRGEDTTVIHLLDYSFTRKVGGVRIRLPENVLPVMTVPFGELDGKPRSLGNGEWLLPDFAGYAQIRTEGL